MGVDPEMIKKQKYVMDHQNLNLSKFFNKSLEIIGKLSTVRY